MFISCQGIFISRVNKGGASEKAGIHVGDRLLEVSLESLLSLFVLFVQNVVLAVSFKTQHVKYC